MLFIENEVDFYKKVVDETIHKTTKRLIVNDTHRGIAFHQKEYTGKGVLIVKIIDIIPLLDKNTRINVFDDDCEKGVLYITPFSVALSRKYNLEIGSITIRNNILNIYTITEKKQESEE